MKKMAQTALLIQPPYGRACEVPYGTLPALAAALRTREYNVIQRDLNVEILFKFLKIKTANKICRYIQKKLDATFEPKLRDKLIFEMVNIKNLLPSLEKLHDAYLAESNKGKYEYKT